MSVIRVETDVKHIGSIVEALMIVVGSLLVASCDKPEDEAREKRLLSKEPEVDAWSELRRQHRVEGYREYIREHPSGRFAAEAREWIGTIVYEPIVGSLVCSMEGQLDDGVFQKPISSVEFEQECLIDSERGLLRVTLNAVNGQFVLTGEKDTVIKCLKSVAVRVDGGLYRIAEDGGEVRVIDFTEIYIPEDGDLMNSCLVSNDMRFGRTDVKRWIDNQLTFDDDSIKSLRTGSPGVGIDTGVKASLFQISWARIMHVR